MSVEVLEIAVRAVVDCLVHGKYEEAVARCDASRLTADELRDVVLEYGRTLAVPPPHAYKTLDAVRMRDPFRQAWSVRAPLWTREEGRSDLTIELTVVLGGDRAVIELDGLHVP